MKKFAASPVLFLSLVLSAWVAPFSFGQDLPEGKGRETLKRVCTQCHDIDSVPRLRYSREDWTSLVYSMKDMGADATTAELDEIVDYLTLNFGKGDAPKTDAAKTDGSTTDAAKTDTAKTDSAKTDDSKTDAAKTDAAKTDTAKSDDAAAQKVNVNTAAAADLTSGLGLTDKESDLIVQYRSKNGNFKEIADLLKVDGVDSAKIQAAKDKIAF
jgi:competence protein ComEA